MTLTSSLRFLYIICCFGPRCAMAPPAPSGTTGLQTVDTILCKISSAAKKPVFKHDCRIICIKYSTDDGRVKFISEIFYGLYQIWELFESCMF